MIAAQSASDSVATLRDALRASTHERHAALDHALMPPESAWTLDRYVRFLRGTLAVIRDAEPEIAATLPAFAVATGTSRAARLQQDLRALGGDTAIDVVPLLADLRAASAAFGAAYVIEGSMLGGQHVARALERDLGLAADRLTYLRAPGVAVGPRWAAFVAELEAFGERATSAEWRTAEAAARAAFDAFAEAFRREGLL